MIVLKLEMWPGGDEKKMYELGRTYINNDGPFDDAKRGNYMVRVCRRGRHAWHQALNQPARSGVVLNYPRQSYNVWRLVLRCLRTTFPEEH